jgi:hypothetical protein
MCNTIKLYTTGNWFYFVTKKRHLFTYAAPRVVSQGSSPLYVEFCWMCWLVRFLGVCAIYLCVTANFNTYRVLILSAEY